MFYYNKGRLMRNGISFEIPDGVYIQTEAETVSEDKIDFISSDASFCFSLQFCETEKEAEEFLQEAYDIFEESYVEIIKPIHCARNKNGVNGYYTKYRTTYKDRIQNYDEYVFELPNQLLLNIYFKLQQSQSNEREYNRIQKALVDSLSFEIF